MDAKNTRHFFATTLLGRTLFLLLALPPTLLSPAMGASLICRWVDEKGHTQVADVVPQKYASVATCTDSEQYELTAQQRREAEQRRAAERSKARVDKAKPPKKTASSATRAMNAASQPSAKRPSEVVTDATDCPTWWRIFDESSECFGPFKMLHGIKPEAFDKCNEVPSPEPKCGLRSN
jgi:hypothetical protein